MAAIAVLLGTTTGLALGEFAARWHHEGSFLEAVDSLTGWQLAASQGAVPPLVVDAELGFRLNPASPGVNSLGLRHAEIVGPKPVDLVRVLLLGDSVGFPMDGLFADLRAHVEASTHRPGDVINACVHGYTTLQERRFLERDLLALQPDLVVLQYCCNDNHAFLHRLTSRGRRLLTREAMAELQPDGTGFGDWLTSRSHLFYSLRQLLFAHRHRGLMPWEDPILGPAFDLASWPAVAGHLRGMRDGLLQVGGRLCVLAIPIEAQLDAALLQADRARLLLPQQQLAVICDQLEVPFLDLHAEFVAHAGKALFTDGLHLTPAGHRLAGQQLAHFLDAQGLLPR